MTNAPLCTVMDLRIILHFNLPKKKPLIYVQNLNVNVCV